MCDVLIGIMVKFSCFLQSNNLKTTRKDVKKLRKKTVVDCSMLFMFGCYFQPLCLSPYITTQLQLHFVLLELLLKSLSLLALFFIEFPRPATEWRVRVAIVSCMAQSNRILKRKGEVLVGNSCTEVELGTAERSKLLMSGVNHKIKK